MPRKKKKNSKTPIESGLRLSEKRSKIARKKPLSIIYYNIASRAQNKIKTVTYSILEKYGRLDLMDSVYTIVKEMAINGTKANMKRIIFEEEKINIRNSDDYKRGMSIFRERLNEVWLEKYYQSMVEKGYTVIINFFKSARGLLIEVTNTVPLYKKEITRIKKKLLECRKYESLLDFYQQHGDETEGEGLGFSMIIILLKSENINPNYFQVITSHKDKTIVKVEIPLENNSLTASEKTGIKL